MTHKQRQTGILTLLVILILAACSPRGAAPTSTPMPATAVPVMPSLPVTPTLPVTPSPTATPTPGAKNLPTSPAAQAAIEALSQQLGIDASKVTLVKEESVEWPDGCLGVRRPGIMCNMLVTPGYRVRLQAGGQQYEYHTNQNGDSVLLAGLFPALSGNNLVVWQSAAAGACSRVEIGQQGVAYGPCGGPLAEGRLAPARAAELTYLQATYTSFAGATQAGQVALGGQGHQEATPAEMRSVAEWARLVGLEAQGKRSGAEWGVALTWHQEGGIANICHDLTLSVTGWASATACKPGQIKPNNPYRLSADELASLYGWLDQYKNFEYIQKDPATADAMSQRLIFTGAGTQVATASQQETVAQFAATIYTEAVK